MKTWFLLGLSVAVISMGLFFAISCGSSTGDDDSAGSCPQNYMQCGKGCIPATAACCGETMCNTGYYCCAAGTNGPGGCAPLGATCCPDGLHNCPVGRSCCGSPVGAQCC